MRLFLLLVALFVAPITAQADTKLSAMPSGVYKLDPTHASLIWKVSHLGLSDYTARFTKFDADIMYNNQAPMESKVKVSIDPTSIETDYPNPEEKDFDKKLVEDTSWFNTGKFPSIFFNSTNLEQTSDTTAKLTGDLTFLGVTKPVVLDVRFNKALGNHQFANKPALGFSATGSLKRSDFGMGTYIPTVGDTVDLVIEAEFIYEG
jgi:polyisoprenoid-binding protein YceI